MKKSAKQMATESRMKSAAMATKASLLRSSKCVPATHFQADLDSARAAEASSEATVT